MKEEQLKEKYMQFQQLQQHIEQITEHLQILNQQYSELDISKGAVEELGKTELNNEILAPIADGILMKTTLQNNQKVVVNVGSDTVVEKTISEAVVLLNHQQKEISQKIKDAEELVQEFNKQAMKIYQEVESSQPQK